MGPLPRANGSADRHKALPWLAVLALLLLNGLLPVPAGAQTFKAVGVDRSLNARVVPALLVDRDGFLWVGSREGLFRYDGYESVAFLQESGNTATSPKIEVRALYQDREGSLWIGTYSHGLSRYDFATGHFEAFRHDPTDAGSVVDDQVLAISEGPDGGLWVATATALSRLDPATRRFEHFAIGDTQTSSRPAAPVTSLHLGDSGRLWIGLLGQGVGLWHPQSRRFSQFDLTALTHGPNEANDVFSLHEAADGTLWVGTRTGLVVLDPARNLAREMALPQHSAYPPAITAMAADDSGRLWLATLAHGVLLVDMQSGRWEMDREGPGSWSGYLQDQPQMSLALSREMLFVGTWGGGVFRGNSQANRFRIMNSANTAGLRDENVTTVSATSEAGRPWLGTYGGGLVRAGTAHRQVEYPGQVEESLNGSMVFDLARTGADELWVGTSRGLFRFSAAGQELEHLVHDPADPSSLGDGFIRSLLVADNGDLWIGLDGSGLYSLDAETGDLEAYRHQANLPDSISSDSITALLEGKAGYLWVGTRTDGLNRCRIGNWSCERFPGKNQGAGDLGHFHVTTLFRDRAGQIWVGTSGGGLHQVLWDSAGQVSGFRRWTSDDGLVDDGIMAIQQDLDGSLWLSSRRGLTHFHPDGGEMINYVAESGLPVDIFNSDAAAADELFIYFGSDQGLLSLPRGSGFQRRQAAPVRITAIEHTPPGGQSTAMHWGRNPLLVPYGDVVSIKLATLDLTESPHPYGYRLHSSESWIPLGQQRQLILHGLAPGRYEFEARGRDVFGSWGQSETLILEIVPPFWMTAAFRALVAVLLVLAALAIHFARQASLRRRAQEIQRLSQKREQALEQRLGSDAELAVLTPRQKEVLQLIAEGNSTKEIAERLGISVKTAEAHRANLMDRLEIRDVPGLVRLAVRAGLVSPYE